jgi:hypothetical protein
MRQTALCRQNAVDCCIETACFPILELAEYDPAIVQVGAIFADFAATITGPQTGFNLGIKTFLNSAPVSTTSCSTPAPPPPTRPTTSPLTKTASQARQLAP